MLHRIGCWGRGWLLLLLWQVTRAFGAQNHTCARTNRVETRVAVPVQEPATFRSYEWCLKVPPRCSKYTVVTRERITYQIEVRNETVAECCPGAVRLYGACVARCPACVNMRCDAKANCTCAPGHLGPLCNQTCEAGKWGEKCAETCICRVGEDCDPATGNCSPSTNTAPSTTTTSTTTTTTATAAPLPPTTTIATTTGPVATTANAFLNLSVSGPAASAEDLTEFNPISVTKNKHSNGDEGNSPNALDLDYPVLPTDSFATMEEQRTYNDRPTYADSSSPEPEKSEVTAGWIGEFGNGHNAATMASALGLVILLLLVVAGAVAVRRARSKVAVTPSPSPLPPPPAQAQCLPPTAKGHYAVPGSPPFTFSYGYGISNVAEGNDDSYDHPRSLRCLGSNEPVYDELRY